MAHAHINHSNIHFRWSKNLSPVLTVKSGAELDFDLRDGFNNLVGPDTTAAQLPSLDYSQVDPAFGPVAIEGAEPGHVVRVDILELTPAPYGWTAVFPDFGLLSDEFRGPHLKIWDLTTVSEGYAEFNKGIRVPTRPFLGVMGLAPGQPGELSTIPPYDWGGNMDCKHLTVGSTLYLPVQAPGALFSCGDGHAAQGDGEVCGTAIETPIKARLRLTLEKDKPWVKSPHFLTCPEAEARADHRRGQEYAAVGIDADLLEATKKGVRGAIDWLCADKGLAREEAYMLCSVVGDLKVVEAVDMPHYAVACSIPLGIFVDEK
ncbi:acetamidase/formamidase [Metarhizium album ARSEF 1941]|uniref:Acetamidase/formamidase n=1 Tax=Metarhizium album (strain ARSEF 1941) TaxID=1081103 RepID=A0A0B2WWQ1_METAS|nr:acetamidase/formamidase [Metarhizium album ARSEF 1941]KHN98039.1 acetamidase/formamidase [Metarhizium album ARSEF 1941]